MCKKQENNVDDGKIAKPIVLSNEDAERRGLMDDLISSLKNGDVFKSKIKHSDTNNKKIPQLFNSDSNNTNTTVPSNTNAAKELLRNLDKGKVKLSTSSLSSNDDNEMSMQSLPTAEPQSTENKGTKETNSKEVEIDMDDWLENSVNKMLEEITKD